MSNEKYDQSFMKIFSIDEKDSNDKLVHNSIPIWISCHI